MSGAVEGVVLAAGRSARMQRPKPALAVGSVTFAERALGTLRAAGCRRLLLVAGADAEWADTAVEAADVVLLRNADPESEQIESLRLALRAVEPDTAAVLVLPVDLPLISVETAAAVVTAFRRKPMPLMLPFHNGVAGHPVLLARELFGAVLEREWEEGVRSLIMEHTDVLGEVLVNDPGILIDIDTPEEYRRFIGRQ